MKQNNKKYKMPCKKFVGVLDKCDNNYVIMQLASPQNLNNYIIIYVPTVHAQHSLRITCRQGSQTLC